MSLAQGSAEVVSELSVLLRQLRKDPEGPELFRRNDRANELLKQLPLQPPGWLGGGRCRKRWIFFWGVKETNMWHFEGNWSRLRGNLWRCSGEILVMESPDLPERGVGWVVLHNPWGGGLSENNQGVV